MLAFGTQVRGFKPGRNRRIFQGEKILSTPSFGGEVKPSVPCRRFTACKRFLNVTWKSGISGKIHWPLLAHIDIFVNCSWVNTRWQCYSTHNQYIEQHNNNRTTQITAQHNSNRKTIAQHNIVPPLATRISGETTSGESWNV